MPTKDSLLLPDVIKKVISLARLVIWLIGKISFLALTSVWTLYFHRNYHPKAFSDFPFPANELLDTNKEQPTRHWAEVLDELEVALDEGDVDFFADQTSSLLFTSQPSISTSTIKNKLFFCGNTGAVNYLGSCAKTTPGGRESSTQDSQVARL